MRIATFLAVSIVCFAAGAPAFGDAPLMLKDVIGMPGKEVRILTVDSAPGAASPMHRHNGQVFVYVLSGKIIMQVLGSPAVTLGPGDTFYESPDDIHSMSKNASDKDPARFLVFMILDKGAPVSIPVK